MNCINCGTENDVQASYCTKCGKELSSSVAIDEKVAQSESPKRQVKVKSIIITVLALVLITAVGVGIWFGLTGRPSPVMRDNKKVITNDKGNLMNGGYYAEIDEGIVSPYPNGYGLRWESENDSKTLHEHPSCWNITTDGEWIYFMQWTKERDANLTTTRYGFNQKLTLTPAAFRCELCKMRLDGPCEIIKTQIYYQTNSVMFFDTFKRFEVERGWIYYKDFNNKGLYKFKTDGTEEELVIGENINDFFVSDEWIYYGTEQGLYKIRINGTEKAKLSSGNMNTDKIMVFNDTIYFIHNGSLQRIHMDGTKDDTFAIIEDCATYNMANDTIYFIRTQKGKTSSPLFMRAIDGAEEKPIADKRAFLYLDQTPRVCIVDNGVNFHINNYLTRIHLDGTDWPFVSQKQK